MSSRTLSAYGVRFSDVYRSYPTHCTLTFWTRTFWTRNFWTSDLLDSDLKNSVFTYSFFSYQKTSSQKEGLTPKCILGLTHWKCYPVIRANYSDHSNLKSSHLKKNRNEKKFDESWSGFFHRRPSSQKVSFDSVLNRKVKQGLDNLKM